MIIKCKDIKRENEKICIMCGRDSNNGGIIIRNNHMCEDCIREITFINIEDRKYEYVKEKIKVALFNNKLLD